MEKRGQQRKSNKPYYYYCVYSLSIMGVTWSQFFPPAPAFTEDDLPSLRDKVFIVTGGYSGVGLELVSILYHAGATVYIAGRSDAKTLDAFVADHRSAMASDRDDAPVFMAKDAWELSYVQQRNPELRFAATKDRR